MKRHAIEFGEILIDMDKTFRSNMVHGFSLPIPSQPVSSQRDEKAG